MISMRKNGESAEGSPPKETHYVKETPFNYPLVRLIYGNERYPIIRKSASTLPWWERSSLQFLSH